MARNLSVYTPSYSQFKNPCDEQKGGNSMHAVSRDFTHLPFPNLKKNVLTTTLYELIEAINEEVQPEEIQQVPEIVVNLLNTYRSNVRVQ